jgi:uncharacterized protein YjbJ (UPF0337 family)
VKRAYGELSDEDIAKADGSRDNLLGFIEKRFGDTKERIIQKIQSIELP